MFFSNSEIELESGCLRSGEIFWLGKRRRNAIREGSCSATRGEYYELSSHLDGGSCDKEEEYQLIYEEAEEEEALDPRQDYRIPMTPHTSPKFISGNTSPSVFSNPTNNNSGTSSQGTPTSIIFSSMVPRVNRMDGNYIKFPIFNGNQLEDPEKLCFLCQSIWTVQ